MAGNIIWMTGLSGSGKTTTARHIKLNYESKKDHIMLLDGDDFRNGLCSDLGFSMEDRSENIRRIAEVASLISKEGIHVVVTAITPLKRHREIAKSICGESFIEVYVKCSIQKCEERDPKGLYEKVRSGKILNFTGISSPYEVPDDPDVVIDTENKSITHNCRKIMRGTGIHEKSNLRLWVL